MDQDKLYDLDYLTAEVQKNRSLPLPLLQKSNRFLQILFSPLLDKYLLRQQCFNGIPDEINGLRSISWKVVLNYLPKEKAQWGGELDKRREEYEVYVEELIASKAGKVGVQQSDHPLSQQSDSQWKQLFEDIELWEEVEKDTRRTRSEMHLFQSRIDSKYPLLVKSAEQTHRDVMTRILFIFAKLNPGIKYIQGMNEILAPIYYVFANDPDETFRERAEVDAFYCFLKIMGEVNENFIRSLDESRVGIKAKMGQVDRLLQVVDPELWQCFQDQGVNPHFYALRWIMLLFTQEYSVATILRLWDSILAMGDNKKPYLFFLTLSLLLVQREALLSADFEGIMALLQSIQTLPIDQVINTANKLYLDYGQTVKE